MWWWDGEQWHAVEGGPEGQAPSEAPPPPRSTRPLGPVLAMGAVFVGLAAIAIVTSTWPPIHSGSAGQPVSPSPPSQRTPAPSPSPSSRPSPTSTARPSPRPTVATYVATVVGGADRMQKQIDSVDHSCTGQASLAACRPTLVALQSSTRQFRADLGGLRPPACLQSMDGELRTGLDLFEQGTGVAIAGIDGHDANEVVNGMQVIQQATGHLDQAVNRTQSASC
jgi:hypothetical protein